MTPFPQKSYSFSKFSNEKIFFFFYYGDARSLVRVTSPYGEGWDVVLLVGQPRRDDQVPRQVREGVHGQFEFCTRLRKEGIENENEKIIRKIFAQM